jgi:hypothetical protein
MFIGIMVETAKAQKTNMDRQGSMIWESSLLLGGNFGLENKLHKIEE